MLGRPVTFPKIQVLLKNEKMIILAASHKQQQWQIILQHEVLLRTTG